MVKTRKNKNKRRRQRQMGGQNVTAGYSNVISPPTIKDNIKKFADIWLQLFNNVGMYTLDIMGNKVSDTSKSLGIDPNKSFKEEFVKLGEKAEKINNALDSPEGKRALLSLTRLFDRINKNVIVPNSEKLAEGLIENLEPIMERGQNAVFALLSASPFGALIDIPRFMSESLGVVEKSVSLADDVLDVSQETVDGLKAEKGNFDKVVSEFDSLVNSANIQVSQKLDKLHDNVNTYGKNVMTNVNNNGKNMMTNVNNYGKDVMTNANDSLKKYQNQARMIGGRANKSKVEFLGYNKMNVKTRKRNNN